jgi:hypothetical protein
VRPDPETRSADDQLTWWQSELAEPSFVYVIQGDDPAIKVGYAVLVPDRVAGLQTGNPQILRLLEVVPGDRRLEWNLHRRLAASRVHGEWFDGPDVPPFLAYLGDLARAMAAAYDGSGRPPRYTDFDTFEPLPRTAPARGHGPRRPRPPGQRQLASPPVVAAMPSPAPELYEPSPEEQALWSRVAQMWIGGASRKEVRGAEGLSQDQLRRVIEKMRANGYELAEGLTLTRDDDQIDRSTLTRRGPYRRRHPWLRQR